MFHFRIVSVNFSRIITTFYGRHGVYEQKNFSSPITVKTVFESNSSRLNNLNDSVTKRCGEIILRTVYLEPGWELNNYLGKFYCVSILQQNT